MQEILLKKDNMQDLQGKLQLEKVRKEKAKGMQFTFPFTEYFLWTI